MQVFQKAISDIRFKIPRQILESVFIDRSTNWRMDGLSIEQQIMDLVVRPRVFVDCNLVGGTEETVSLAGVPYERVNDVSSVYRIPKERTQGRSILSVSNITFVDPTKATAYGAIGGENNSTMMRVGDALVNSMGSIPMTSTARVQLIAENVVMVTDYVVLPANIYLRCTLGYDQDMSNISPRSYLPLSKLVEFAVKAYIYNEMIVRMDMAQIYAGNSLGTFKEVIDGYADANELYETHLKEVIQKVLFMNDADTYYRHLRLLIGGNR